MIFSIKHLSITLFSYKFNQKKRVLNLTLKERDKALDNPKADFFKAKYIMDAPINSEASKR